MKTRPEREPATTKPATEEIGPEVRPRFRDLRTKISPKELALMWGKKASSIIALIRTGELRAIDVSVNRGRPRFLIDMADIAIFEERRAVQPPIRRTRARRHAEPGVVSYL